jgi:predicted nucleotidyltransferase
MIENLLAKASLFARETETLRIVLLVGSYARGAQRIDSDIDLILLSDDPEALILQRGIWIQRFGAPVEVALENWGDLSSVRVEYPDMEIEFGISGLKWISSPLDPGTERVLKDGYRVIADKDNRMESVFKE